MGYKCPINIGNTLLKKSPSWTISKHIIQYYGKTSLIP